MYENTNKKAHIQTMQYFTRSASIFVIPYSLHQLLFYSIWYILPLRLPHLTNQLLPVKKRSEMTTGYIEGHLSPNASPNIPPCQMAPYLSPPASDGHRSANSHRIHLRKCTRKKNLKKKESSIFSDWNSTRLTHKNKQSIIIKIRQSSSKDPGKNHAVVATKNWPALANCKRNK